MAEEKANKKATGVKLTDAQKYALYDKVEIPIQGSKEKIVNYNEKQVELVATESAKHLKPGKTYMIDSSTAVVLIEKGFAELAK
jgi:DeoR/GlpR family transcriptional regulator of sugar metabolism